MADTEITVQAQDTGFYRFGTSVQNKGYFLVFTDGPIPYLTTSYISTQVPPAVVSSEISKLYELVVQDQQCLPGGSTLKDIQEMVPELFSGAGDLQAIYQKDPFGTEYEDETRELYERQFLIARSTAQSGPTNVRGGTARQGFELAELDTQMAINRFREIWQAQIALVQHVISSVQVTSQTEAARRNDMLNAQRLQAVTEQGRVQASLAASEQLSQIRTHHLRALAAGSEFLGIPQMITTENMIGYGFQQGVTTSFGSSYWR